MPSYLNYVQILIILASVAVASPVERRDATCQPNFNYVRVSIQDCELCAKITNF